MLQPLFWHEHGCPKVHALQKNVQSEIKVPGIFQVSQETCAHESQQGTYKVSEHNRYRVFFCISTGGINFILSFILSSITYSPFVPIYIFISSTTTVRFRPSLGRHVRHPWPLSTPHSIFRCNFASFFQILLFMRRKWIRYLVTTVTVPSGSVHHCKFLISPNIPYLPPSIYLWCLPCYFLCPTPSHLPFSCSCTSTSTILSKSHVKLSPLPTHNQIAWHVSAVVLIPGGFINMEE